MFASTICCFIRPVLAKTFLQIFANVCFVCFVADAHGMNDQVVPLQVGRSSLEFLERVEVHSVIQFVGGGRGGVDIFPEYGLQRGPAQVPSLGETEGARITLQISTSLRRELAEG